MKRRTTSRAGRRRYLLLAIATMGAVTLATGCSILDGPTPERPERPVVEVPETPAQYLPDGSAEENLPIFVQTLQQASTVEGAIMSQELATAFTRVGFNPALMQVTQDRTRTDLEPESMFVSARFDEECLVGQIVTADRSIEASVMPAVGPDGGLCLIGNTVPIEG